MSQQPPNPIFIGARTARRARALGALGALALLASAAPGVARAATTATAAFSSPGQYTFVVPPGVTSVTVTAVGGTGGSCHSAGGQAAALTATVPVVPDETLFVGVGGPGSSCDPDSDAGAAGGTGGGGAGTRGNLLVGAAGGGGASLVGLASSPSASFGPQLLVVAGAGGGGAFAANGGDAGSAGQTPNAGSSGGGGGPGTSTAGGSGGSGVNGANGASGSFGIGGSGGPCSQLSVESTGAGGGGGGYFGGGGGGCGDQDSGGGGGGSSFAFPGATNVSMALSSAAPSVAITYAAPTADESTTTMQFGTQALGTAGPAQVLTVTNNGSAPLVVSGLLLGGADPEDFLIGDRCQQPVAVGSSCQVGVRFHPQVSGARSATLTLLTNAASAPPAVALAGGSSSRATGPAGKVELLTCKPAGEGLIEHKRGRAHPAAETCTGKRVRGTVKFTATGAATRARLVRGRVVFAIGASVATARGGSELVLTERRPLTRGAYTLILRHRHARRWITQRLPIILR